MFNSLISMMRARWSRGAILLRLTIFALLLVDGVRATGSIHTSALKRRPRNPKDVTEAKQKLTAALRRDVSSEDVGVSAALSVESFLLPRRLPLKALIQLFTFACVIWSFGQCLATAGIPHIKTIWGMIHGADASMPNDYRPSSAEFQLSRLIASATNELLPPISLPSAGPLIGLFFSLLFYVGSSFLLPRWFTAIKVFLEYRKVPAEEASWSDLIKNPSKAAVLVHITDEHLQQQVLADPSMFGGSKSLVICQLRWSTDSQFDRKGPSADATLESDFTHPSQNFFDINQGRFYVDVETGTCIDGGPHLHSASFRDLQQLLERGIANDHLEMARQRYVPYNRPTLAIPTIREAFVARISSPLVVVQVLGRLLACLEEGMQSLINIFFTALEHYANARRAVAAARQMAEEVQANMKDTSSAKILLLRREGNAKTWMPATSGDLVPGDVFVILQESENIVVPVDALLLTGQGLANEAVLTGESVPQSKVPISFTERVSRDSESRLDMDADRNSVLFAGTTLIHCASPANQTTVQGFTFPAHNQTSGAVCLALRTGTYSSKGRLLRTLKGGGQIGAISNAQSQRDALRLILSLSVFAVGSCASLFLPTGSGDQVGEHVPAFRRIIQCTRIAIASIPTDLALALSAVARSCSVQLRTDSDVICSEPGSLLTAAYVDTVVFDKVRSSILSFREWSLGDNKFLTFGW